MRLTLTNIGHSFHTDATLFDGVNQTLTPGNVYSLTGPSGSGKSTLMGIIAGWIKPTTGTIETHGINKTTWVFQSPVGNPKRTVLDHVVFPYLTRGINRHDAEHHATQRLQDFGLAHRSQHQFRSLSGGEGQRLMLARAAATQADLLLVDEPTAQLDIATARSVATVITKLAADNTIVIIATHDTHTRDACTHHINLGEYVPRTS